MVAQWSQPLGKCNFSDCKVLVKTSKAKHYLIQGCRVTAKCKEGYSSLTSQCLPAETQQLSQEPKGGWNAPASNRTGDACCRLMFSTKSLSWCVLKGIQGTNTGDQTFSPVFWVLPGRQVMQYDHIISKVSRWIDMRVIKSPLSGRRGSLCLLWDVIPNQGALGLEALSLRCWYAVAPSWIGLAGSSTSW